LSSNVKLIAYRNHFRTSASDLHLDGNQQYSHRSCLTCERLAQLIEDLEFQLQEPRKVT
jgi:hypothetical protein